MLYLQARVDLKKIEISGGVVEINSTVPADW